MSTKYLNSLEDIANQLGLSLHKQMEIIYGNFNNYKACLIPSNETQTFTLKLSLNRKSDLPDSELTKQI